MIRTTCASLLAAGLTLPAWADETFPNFSADFVIEIQNDYTFSSTDPAAELNDTFATIETALSLAITGEASINATLLFEPVLGPADDRFFEDHGFYAQELFFQYDFGAAALIFGKFNPAFGSAWDIAPGIYGVDFAEDYELTEQIGASLNVPFEAAGGEHEFTLSAFMADRTILSNSAVQDRGRTNGRDGGPANTQSPESIAASLSGAFGGTGYNLGVQYLGEGQGDADNQSGVVLGLTQAIGIGDGDIELLAEGAYFPHFGGAEASLFVGTFGASVPIGPASLSGVYAVRDAEGAPTDHLATTSVEFEVIDGLTAGLGYRFGREGGETGHTLGALLVYEFGVTAP